MDWGGVPIDLHICHIYWHYMSHVCLANGTWVMRTWLKFYTCLLSGCIKWLSYTCFCYFFDWIGSGRILTVRYRCLLDQFLNPTSRHSTLPVCWRLMCTLVNYIENNIHYTISNRSIILSMPMAINIHNKMAKIRYDTVHLVSAFVLISSISLRVYIRPGINYLKTILLLNVRVKQWTCTYSQL